MFKSLYSVNCPRILTILTPSPNSDSNSYVSMRVLCTKSYIRLGWPVIFLLFSEARVWPPLQGNEARLRRPLKYLPPTKNFAFIQIYSQVHFSLKELINDLKIKIHAVATKTSSQSNKLTSTQDSVWPYFQTTRSSSSINTPQCIVFSTLFSVFVIVSNHDLSSLIYTYQHITKVISSPPKGFWN